MPEVGREVKGRDGGEGGATDGDEGAGKRMGPLADAGPVGARGPVSARVRRTPGGRAR